MFIVANKVYHDGVIPLGPFIPRIAMRSDHLIASPIPVAIRTMYQLSLRSRLDQSGTDPEPPSQ